MITTEWILVLDQVILHTHPSLMMRAVHTIIGVLLIMIPTVHAQQGRIATIITANTTLNKLGGGMKFTEGPVWIPEKQALIFSDIPNSMLMRWSARDGLKPFRKVAQTNGNLLDLQGRLMSCQHAGRNVIRTEHDGTLTVLANQFEGKKFNSPNDLAIKSDGSIWFTDPSYGLRGKPGEIPGKWVFRLDGTSNRVTVVYKGFDMPNGIAFSPDEKHLYIADTGKDGVIRAFDVTGKTIKAKPAFEIPIRCDGMCVDTRGNIYTTSKGGVYVFDKQGDKLGLIPTPEDPTNVCFGGKDFGTLFITARTSLYSIKTLMVGSRPPQTTP
jgi:gluconolactonase